MILIAFAALAACQNEKKLKVNLPLASILTDCTGEERCTAGNDTVTIANTEFNNIANTAELEGGAVSLTFCVFTCTNSRFISCSTSSSNGGAIYFFNQKVDKKQCAVSNCYFSQNHAGVNGGAVFFSQSKHETSSFINCIFESNSADGTGSDFYGFGQSILIQNCTFANKDASIKGPLFAIQNSCQKTFAWANSIISCTFTYTCDSSSVSPISLLGSTNLKPIEISRSCFLVDLSSSASSSLKYIDTKTPVTFLESNAFGVSQDQSISGTSISYNGTNNYNSNQCVFSPSQPSSNPTSAPTSNPTSAPTSNPTYKPPNNYDKDAKDAADKEYNKEFKNFIIIIAVSVAVFIVVVLTLVIVLIYVKLKYPNDGGEVRSEIPSVSYKGQLGEELF